MMKNKPKYKPYFWIDLMHWALPLSIQYAGDWPFFAISVLCFHLQISYVAVEIYFDSDIGKVGGNTTQAINFGVDGKEIEMKGYKFIVWREHKYGGNSTSRNVIIHARNLKEAWKKFNIQITLKDYEFVYDVKCLGRAKKVITETFIYEPLKHPHYESNYGCGCLVPACSARTATAGITRDMLDYTIEVMKGFYKG